MISTITQIRSYLLFCFMVKMNLKTYLVILAKEIPATDVKNVNGMLKCQESQIIFQPLQSDTNMQRIYSLSDFQNISITTIGRWFTKKEVVLLKFKKA